jgi:hypothetical protein
MGANGPKPRRVPGADRCKTPDTPSRARADGRNATPRTVEPWAGPGSDNQEVNTMTYEDAKANVKESVREVDNKAKEAWRNADGEESLSDKVANAGDDVRDTLGNAGDELRRTASHIDGDSTNDTPR